jgi:hypothetical protein
LTISSDPREPRTIKESWFGPELLKGAIKKELANLWPEECGSPCQERW